MRYTRWDQPVAESNSYDLLKEAALWHFEKAGSAGSPFADFLRRGDFRSLLSLDLDYSKLSFDEARHIRQGCAFFAKRKDINLGFDRRAVALRKFRASEVKCRETNEIFRLRAQGKFQLFPRTERVLYHAARKISSMLGKVPSLTDLKLRFGPGATTQVQKRMASAREKLGHTPACSSELSPIAHLVLDEMPAWADALKAAGPLPLEIHSGKVVFVPKSAKEERSVMIEPSLNTMCQAGIGSYMAERLRRAGVDIRDQTRNQRLARKGSVDGSLATVDLSSASDTIATELVYDLLPPEWFFFLSRFRTGTAMLGKEVLRLEKFSSMGNGFTFPLETAIFYALAFGVCVEMGLPVSSVSAYGDDIIIPTAGFDLLSQVLADTGFSVNLEKSFSKGPFRESCGADYYLGVDIRPVYLKDRLFVWDLFRLHNHYVEWWLDQTIPEMILSLLDPSIRIFGPPGYGDGHLVGDWVPRRSLKHSNSGYGGFVFDTFTRKPIRSFRKSKGDRVLPTYSIYLREYGNDEWGVPSIGVSDCRYERGELSVTTPGFRGIKRISIYVLSAR